MSIILKKNELNIKDPLTGEYTSNNVIAEQSTEQMVASIQSAGATQISAIETKGAETRESIPSDYTSLSDEVADLKADLKDAIAANEYTPGVSYAAGDLVWRNDILYKSKGNFTDSSWTAGHWTKTSLADEILQTARELCNPYDATSAYAVGSYVRSATDVYRCIIAIPDGGESWTAGHWQKITGGTYSDIGTKVVELNADVVNVSGGLEAVEADALQIKNDMISSGGMFPTSFFAVGDINTSGVVVPSVRYRVCTPDTFTVKNDMVITIDEGYILSLWLYPVGASAYVQHGSGFTIPANTNARVLIRKVPEDTSAVADVNEFVSALFLKLYEFEPHKINQLSYDIPDDRYKNIAYVDLLAEIPSIDRRSAGGVYIDYDVKFQVNPYSIRMLTAEGENINSSEIRFTLPSAFTLAGTQELDMFVYIPDATGITNFSLRTLTGGFVKSNYPGIVRGWNRFRFFTEGAGNVDFTASITTFRFIVTHAANTAKNIYIAGLLQIKPDKGNLIMVDDGPYKTFYDIAYPAFKAINCPVTWAIDPELLGDNTDPDRQNVSQEEINVLAFDGLSEFSFHNYDGTIMSTATAQEALADTLNCIRYLRKNGIEPQHIFRASWLQNNCPNHELADLEVEASATYNGSAGITMYPFPDRYNIARFSMQGRTTAAIDTIFDKLKNQHCTVFMYTHGISDDSDKNLTNALLQYYVGKIEAGISEGWLNPTTYNRLVNFYSKID